jgi:stearoyl-CoA desaturase (delta-9 desaturase)
MSYKHKHLSLIIACIIFAIALPFFVTINWWAWIIIPTLFMLTKPIGSEVGAHRLWSHRSFSTTPWMEKILIILHTFAGEGSIIAYAGIHRLHHKYSDTEQDPHSPKYINWWAIVFYQHNTQGFTPTIIKDLLSNSWLKWQHKNYFNIHLAVIAALIVTSPLALWYYAINVLFTLWIHFLVNIGCHHWGSRNFDTHDSSTNNAWMSPFLLGVHLHNNHHAAPGSYTNVQINGSGKCNFDLCGSIANLIRKKSPVSLPSKDQ